MPRHRVPPAAVATPPNAGLNMFNKSHKDWFVRCILLLVTFLHTTYHVPFRACGIILIVLKTILLKLELLPSTDNMPTTLGTAFSRLGFTDNFIIQVMCPQCHQLIHAAKSNFDFRDEAYCQSCQVPLYTGIGSKYFNYLIPPKFARPPAPKLVSPYAPLKLLLTEFLSRPGLEENVESWRDQTDFKGTFRGPWDGAVWKSIKDVNGEHFFKKRMDNELRLGVTCGLDWYNIFFFLLYMISSPFVQVPGSTR